MESDRAVSNYVNKYVGTSRGLLWIWTSTHVYYIPEKIVERYFYEQKDDPELFNSLYHDFEKLCYEGYLPIRGIASLHNFIVSDLKKM